MNILGYVKELAPVMERRELLKQLEQLQIEYDDTISPVLMELEEVFSQMSLKSVLNRKIQMAFSKRYNGNKPAVLSLLSSIKVVRGNFDTLKAETKSLFAIQFTNVNLSFNRASLLKYIEAVAFYLRYTRKMALFLVAQEAALLGKATRQRWSSAETDWVESNINQYVELYLSMSVTPQQLKQNIRQASDAIVNDETYQVAEQTLGQERIDPLKLDNFSPRHNPFLILGRLLAEYQVERYLLSQQELYGLQLRLEELRVLLQGDPTSPTIQKQIEAYENRISDYEFEIAKLEERAQL